MSQYIIHTYSFFPKGEVELIVKKNKENKTFEVKSRWSDLIIKEKKFNNKDELKQNISNIWIPEEFFKYIESNNFYEVVLFKQGEIFTTNWTYNELEDFDKKLYIDHTYEIIKLLKDNKITYNFKEEINKIEIKTLEIKIKIKQELLKTLDTSIVKLDYLDKIIGVKELIYTLRKNYEIKDYNIQVKKDNNFLNVTIQTDQPDF